MRTDRWGRGRLATRWGPVVAVGVLVAVAVSSCGSGGSDGVDLGADGPPSSSAGTSDAPAGPTTGVAEDPSSTTTAPAPPSAGDATLALAVERRGVAITVTAGDDPLVVLADLSGATVEVDGTTWSVAITRAVGSRRSGSDLPDAYEGVLVQPGASVEVGPYELGPRPPSALRLCLEVVPASAAEAQLASGDDVLLPSRDGPPATLCATTTVG